jgi:hypothetical protein
MARFSAFSPLGQLRFSAKAPSGAGIYRAIVAAQSGAFDMSPGTEGDAEAYATAMALARARTALDRGAAQHDPTMAIEMLPVLERDYGVIPGEGDSIRERQRALAARIAISGGPREESIENGLRTLLGADFIAYRVQTVAEAGTWPADPSAGPGIFGRDEIAAKLFRITSTIVTTGMPVAFSYAPIDTDDGTRLAPGDVVCVQPDNRPQAEKVAVESVENLTATATFAKAHGGGDILTTGPIPLWSSTKRYAIVVVSDAAVASRETRRKIDDFMGRVSRGVTTWSVFKRSSTTTLGPFVAGDAAGTKPITTITIP